MNGRPSVPGARLRCARSAATQVTSSAQPPHACRWLSTAGRSAAAVRPARNATTAFSSRHWPGRIEKNYADSFTLTIVSGRSPRRRWNPAYQVVTFDDPLLLYPSVAIIWYAQLEPSAMPLLAQALTWLANVMLLLTP